VKKKDLSRNIIQLLLLWAFPDRWTTYPVTSNWLY